MRPTACPPQPADRCRPESSVPPASRRSRFAAIRQVMADDATLPTDRPRRRDVGDIAPGRDPAGAAHRDPAAGRSHDRHRLWAWAAWLRSGRCWPQPLPPRPDVRLCRVHGRESRLILPLKPIAGAPALDHYAKGHADRWITTTPIAAATPTLTGPTPAGCFPTPEPAGVCFRSVTPGVRR